MQELDAASNNKVEEVRELISRVALGSPGRTKVYILDEVHMLTPAASAALLKTLEEPPDHVVFVLATTDPQKVLPTIRSRTQHYEFRLLGADELAEHVRWVIDDAGLDLGDDAVEYVVRQGGGSARDTLSALERVAAAGGVVDDGEALGDLLDAVAEADAGKALLAVAEAVGSGRDPRVLGEALLARLRDVFLAAHGRAARPPPSRRARPGLGLGRPARRPGHHPGPRGGRATPCSRCARRPTRASRSRSRWSRSAARTRDASLDALLARVAALEAALAGGAVRPALPLLRRRPRRRASACCCSRPGCCCARGTGSRARSGRPRRHAAPAAPPAREAPAPAPAAVGCRRAGGAGSRPARGPAGRAAPRAAPPRRRRRSAGGPALLPAAAPPAPLDPSAGCRRTASPCGPAAPQAEAAPPAPPVPSEAPAAPAEATAPPADGPGDAAPASGRRGTGRPPGAPAAAAASPDGGTPPESAVDRSGPAVARRAHQGHVPDR